MQFRNVVFGALCACFALVSVAPAFADDDWREHRGFEEHRREEWREHAWREHEWRERQEREQAWRERSGSYARPTVIPPQFNAPPPAFYYRSPRD